MQISPNPLLIIFQTKPRLNRMYHAIEKKVSMMNENRQVNRSKSSIFSTFMLPLVVVIIFVVGILSNLSLQSTIFKTVEISDVNVQIKTIVPYLPLSSKQDDAGEVHSQQREQVSFPLKTARNLQDIEIFKSNDLSEKFHGRVIEFFKDECEVKFIMTWISPVNSFGSREFLAVESVFKAHPHGCLMILSSTMDSPEGQNILKPFLDRGFEVLAATPDLPFLLKNTPAESWLKEMMNGQRDPGKIPLAQNLSNLMRLAMLYKYGGVYLDTDFIVLKSFKGLRNSIGAQTIDAKTRNWSRLNNAVLIFDKNHPLVMKFIEEFASTFNGNKWGHNGPYLVSRVVRKVEGRPGYNFTVLPPVAFYPVNWIEIEKLFKIPAETKDLKWVAAKLLQLSERAYGLHLWNKFSKKFDIEKDSAIRRLVSANCVICKNVQR